MIRAAVLLCLALAGTGASALDFSLPGNARLTVERNTGPDIYTAPLGVYDPDGMAGVTVEGEVRRSAWKINTPGLTPFQVMRPLRAQLVAAGFDIALDCPARTCGGFDFRFATETLPGPNMYVNIRAFQFVTGTRSQGGAVTEVVTLLTSTTASSAYVQIIHAGAGSDAAIQVEASADVPRASGNGPSGDLVTSLLQHGHAVLDDLDFATGTTNLGPGPFAVLSELAAFLAARPDVRVALVGHTDTVGGLQANIAISRARAAAVRDRLISVHGVGAARLDAEGMGYLAPIASNRQATGRERNRRVEVVLLEAR